MEQQLIHPQTYTLLKGKQPPSYYSTEEKMLERGREIIEGVAKFFNYTVDEMLARSNKREFVEPRHIAAYLIKQKTILADGRIGELIKRDRTTAINSCNTIKDIIDINHPQEVVDWVKELRCKV